MSHISRIALGSSISRFLQFGLSGFNTILHICRMAYMKCAVYSSPSSVFRNIYKNCCSFNDKYIFFFHHTFIRNFLFSRLLSRTILFHSRRESFVYLNLIATGIIIWGNSSLSLLLQSVSRERRVTWNCFSASSRALFKRSWAVVERAKGLNCQRITVIIGMQIRALGSNSSTKMLKIYLSFISLARVFFFCVTLCLPFALQDVNIVQSEMISNVHIFGCKKNFRISKVSIHADAFF